MRTVRATKKKKRVDTQLTSWKPTLEQQDKINQLKGALIIESNTGLVIKALGELYERTFPDKTWV